MPADAKPDVPAVNIDAAEVATHKTATDCWITLNGIVYDITQLLPSHPGGVASLLAHAGTDATETFTEIHPSDTLPTALEAGLVIPLGHSTAPAPSPTTAAPPLPELPPLESQLSIHHFEATAKQLLAAKAWAYYASASDDLVTYKLNESIFSRILLRARIFRDVRVCDTRTKLLGMETALPIFISPCAQARLAHPSGECGIAAAAAKANLVYCVSNNASMTVEEISGAADTGVLWWQLYVQDNRDISAKMLRRIQAPGMRYSAVVVTLDAPVPGKREADLAQGGVGKQLFAGTSASLVWEDLEWVRERWSGPLVLKGLQTWEDVVLAAKAGVQGVILSNHGGRALDGVAPAVLVLLEVRRYAPWVFGVLEVMVDGGVRRGTDVMKCVALGARAVGVGRPALWGLAGYGSAGVGKVLEILGDEVETAVRLLGEKGVEDVRGKKACVNARMVEGWVWEGEGEGAEGVAGLKAKL